MNARVAAKSFLFHRQKFPEALHKSASFDNLSHAPVVRLPKIKRNQALVSHSAQT